MKYPVQLGQRSLLLGGAARLVATLCLAACGQAAMIGPEPNEPGVDPGAASAEQHRAAAEREEMRLEQHRKLYDPNALQRVRVCNPEHADEHPGAPKCWVEAVNPTAIHLSEMEAHRNRSAFHRKSARDLTTVVAAACAGLTPSDLSLAEFAEPRQLLGVGQLEEAAVGVPGARRTVGATIFVRAEPGLTGPKLQRIVDCHLARTAANGYGLATTEARRSPVSERGARATVRSLGNVLAVEVRADDPYAGRAIWLRAQRLAVVE